MKILLFHNEYMFNFNKLKLLLLSAIIIITMLLGCNNVQTYTDKSETYSIVLKAQKIHNTKKMSEILKIQNYVVLETNDSCIIGEISKLIVSDDNFWLLDKISKSVFCFDINGKFKFKIHSVGKGPKEYMRLTNFSYSKGKLFIYDTGNKLLEYDNNGIFKSENYINLFATEFDIIDNFNFVFFCNYYQNKIPYNVLITDNKLNIKGKYLPNSYISTHNLIRNVRNSSLFCEILSIWEHYNDTIYQFSKGILLRKYAINYSNNNSEIASVILKMVNSKNANASIVNKYEKEKNYCTLLTVQETNNHLILLYQQDSFFHYVFFDKQTRKFLDLSKEMSDESPDPPFINDLDGGRYYVFAAADEKYVYSFTTPWELLNCSITNDVLEQVKPKLNENGNPVITFFKINNLK